MKTAPAGICHLCKAGMQNCDWEDATPACNQNHEVKQNNKTPSLQCIDIRFLWDMTGYVELRVFISRFTSLIYNNDIYICLFHIEKDFVCKWLC